MMALQTRGRWGGAGREVAAGVAGSCDGVVHRPVVHLRHRGSGLGLAICYQLVDALGSSVTVESTVGVGATFMIRLPAWD
jgi:nitrogen-specific signal transduction histidine kinase